MTHSRKKVYVASSWRNLHQPGVVQALRVAGHDVYDFRNPTVHDHGFHWSAIDPRWRDWSPREYRIGLTHDLATRGYVRDMEALAASDVVVGVQPFGISASLEMGWAAGCCKRTVLLIGPGEPELMVKMFDVLCTSLEEVVSAI